VFVPATASEFTDHPEGDHPAMVTALRTTKTGRMLVFRTAYGYGGKAYAGQWAESYAAKTCREFGVATLDAMVGRRCFASFKGHPHFARDLVPAVELPADDDAEGFLPPAEVQGYLPEEVSA